MTVAESEKEGESMGHPDTSEIRDVNVFCKVYSTMQILLQLELNVITLALQKGNPKHRKGAVTFAKTQNRSGIALDTHCLTSAFPL